MSTYYCNKCDHVIGLWMNEFNDYNTLEFCDYKKSENSHSIYLLNCKKCTKFLGILCYLVCTNCFGKEVIYGKKKIIKWMTNFRKIQDKKNYYYTKCTICKTQNFRKQLFFFEELTSLKT